MAIIGTFGGHSLLVTRAHCEPVVVKRAESFFLKLSCAKLVVRKYASHPRRKLLANNWCSVVRIFAGYVLQNKIVICARQNGRTVGTITIIPDGKRGLPIDTVFPEAKAIGNRVEMGDLAIAKGYSVKDELLGAAITHVAMTGNSAVVITVNKFHRKFYAEEIGFELLANGEERICPKVETGGIAMVLHPHASLTHPYLGRSLLKGLPWN